MDELLFPASDRPTRVASPSSFHQYVPADRIADVTLPNGVSTAVPRVEVFADTRAIPAEPLPVLPVHLLAIATCGTADAQYRLGQESVQSVRIEPGTTMFLEAKHEMIWGWEAANMEIACVYLPPVFFKKVAVANGWDDQDLDLTSTVIEHDRVLRHLAHAMVHEMCIAQAPFRVLVGSLVEALLIRLLHAHIDVPDLSDADGPLSRLTIREIRAFIRSNLSESITVEDLAKRVGLSSSYFSRLFKETTGTSPYRYVVRERIEEAQRRLKTTDQSISAIAYATGFSSQSHLTRQFREITGLTPAVYRKAVDAD